MRVVIDGHERIFADRRADDSPLRLTSIDRSFAMVVFDHLLDLMLGQPSFTDSTSRRAGSIRSAPLAKKGGRSMTELENTRL
jgi:hypothetical protein